NNQQVLPEKINNILLDIKNKEKASIENLKDIVKIASYEGLL
ncbi:hypothetical protein MNBD_GAMMA10-2867, partial [hydrothermal vent metagenome]